MVRDSAMVTIGSYRKPPSLFPMVRSMTPNDLLFSQKGVPNSLLVIYRISNGHISATGHPIHFMFGSSLFRIGGSNGTISKMAAGVAPPSWKITAASHAFPVIARLSCFFYLYPLSVYKQLAITTSKFIKKNNF